MIRSKGKDRLLGRHERRAIREYVCADCKGPISPGQTYINTAYIQDGKFAYDRSHTGWGWCIDQENR